ncbi:undecaprenyl/decaprenyl-phosphate alpha-N-acetylglucosaminyl 1-phosphate transferase [Ralstonia pickettii]|uniref:MraY family glycosyltransferase n=1 Tax=Ralstonia pickettii TaxID=329 RepID=UPI002714C6BD|nr:MraY family glycosyltransferase [Ralstonia pickettii]WKZ85926.1 undecaprenyl/decaprenyl-phosphate alpha-N-acetylglucosaminyl 1-phosphate transferase [Ralstonia pickettii]
MFDFFWVPALAFLLCVITILLLRPFAVVIGLVDRPNVRKRHDGDVPLVGGIAMTVAVTVTAVLFVRVQGSFIPLLAGMALLAMMGVLDDVKNVAPMTKLVVQLCAAILMTSWGGVYLTSLGDLFSRREIELANWGIPLTLFAVVAVVNALNMCDGMDGLAGGLGFVIFAWFAYIAGEIGNGVTQRICVIFCGALIGFLVFNIRNPLRGKLRVFLGDAGSLMLGYAIVWFAVELSQSTPSDSRHVPPVVMLWVLGFILIDLLAVVLRRMLKGKNPLAADRTHLHHILLRLDLKPESIVWILVFSNSLMGLIGVVGWKTGMSEQGLFLLFLGVTIVHLLVMRNAWRFIRFGRKLVLAKRRVPE